MASTKRPTKIPSFNSKIPGDVDPAVRDSLNAVIEALDVRLGRRGDPIDRAITLRELIESGLAKELADKPFNPNNIRGSSFAPAEPFKDVSVPPQPTGVTATGGYSLITVFWNFPLYGNHSQTEIWRHSADILGNATLVGTSGGRSFVDSVGQSADYYYWVRHVSTSGVPGPWHASNGLHATTPANVTEILSVLSGAITNSQLATALKSRIDLIDASASVPNSVAAQIVAESTARGLAITAAAGTLQSQINALATVAAYNGATAYVVGNQVTSGGFLYQCILATTGNAPPNATYWLLLGAFSSLGAGVAANTTDIVQLNTITAGSTSASALYLYGLNAQVNHATTGLPAAKASIDQINNVSAGTTSASALYLLNLNSQVNHATTGLPAATAAIGQINTVTTGSGSANARALATLSATVNDPISGLAVASAAIIALNTVSTGSSSANAVALAGLSAQVNHATTGLPAAKAAIDQINTVTAGTTSANALYLYNLNGQVNDAVTGLPAAKASIDQINNVSVGTSSANALYLYGLNAQVNHATTGLPAANAKITSLNDVSAGTSSANALYLFGLNAQVNHATTGLPAAKASIDQINNVTAGTSSANALYLFGLNAQVNHATTGLPAAKASIDQINNVTAGTTSANALYLFGLNAQVNHATTGLPAAKASIDQINTVSAGSSSATARAVSQLNTTVYDPTTGLATKVASIESNYYTKAEGDIVEAQYTLKLNVNGRVSGFGISSDTTTGSQFVILADRFSIVSPYSDAVTAVPFIVQATSVTVGGVSVPAGVYINDAFIMNGTIVNAKIANAAIDDAKIANLSANKITTGTLDTSRLNIDGSTLVSVAGVLQLGNVYVNNLVAGSITTDKLIGAAVNNVVTSEIFVANSLPTNATFENVDAVNVVKEIADSSLIVDFQMEATCTGSGNYALYAYIKVDGVIQSRLFSFFMTKSFASTVQGRVVIVGLGTGTKQVQLSVQANVSGAGVATATVNSSTLIITEVKR